MPPQLFRAVGRMRRTASTNSDENQDAFHGYKALMEEIKRDHPELTPSAVQQMAMERFSGGGKEEHRNRLNEIMSGMTKFQFGLGNGEHRRNDRKSSQDETASTVPSANENDVDPNDPEGRRRCMARRLNPRVSVKNIDSSKALSQSFLSGISSDEDSLEDSLQNIEASISPPLRSQGSKRGLRSSLKCSARASLTRSSTELVDVQEDKELHASIPDTLAQSHQDLHSTKSNSSKSFGSQKKANGNKDSMSSDELPDEIKEALGEFYYNDDGRRSVGSEGRKEGSLGAVRTSRFRESNCSSFASIDSAAFEGDFSAWGSKNSA